MKLVDGLVVDATLTQLTLHIVQANLVELVDSNGDVNHLVGVADRLCDAEQYFAVVHLERHRDAELRKYAGYDVDQLHLAEQRLRADNIDITLVELAVATLLGAVSTPYGLNLVALERKDYLVLVLHDIARKGNGEVVTKTLLRNLRCLTKFILRELCAVVTRVEYLEEELVALVAVLAE